MRRPLFTFAIPSDVLSALMKAGYRTYDDLFESQLKSEPSCEVNQILDNYGFNWLQFKDIIDPPSCEKALQSLQNEKLYETIPTFSEALDNILGGGVHAGKLLLICGPPGSGKTQLLLQLCLDVQIPECLGGLGSSAIFIDSENCFSKSRLLEMAEATVQHCLNVGKKYLLQKETQNLTVEKFIEGVKYLDVTGHIELLASINSLKDYLLKNQVKLIVLDSIVMCLLTLPSSLERTRYFSRIVKELNHLAKLHSLAVVVVNDLTTWISPYGDKILLPSLGESASHLFSTILLLCKNGQNVSAVVQKSSSQPQFSADFLILKEGIRDNC